MSKETERLLQIAEQVFKDPILGATFQFKFVPGSSDPYRIQIHFDHSTEVREIRFDENGLKSGSGTKMQTAPELPGKLRLVK